MLERMLFHDNENLTGAALSAEILELVSHEGR
jgi:hypothetical protein